MAIVCLQIEVIAIVRLCVILKSEVFNVIGIEIKWQGEEVPLSFGWKGFFHDKLFLYVKRT